MFIIIIDTNQLNELTTPTRNMVCKLIIFFRFFCQVISELEGVMEENSDATEKQRRDWREVRKEL